MLLSRFFSARDLRLSRRFFFFSCSSDILSCSSGFAPSPVMILVISSTISRQRWQFVGKFLLSMATPGGLLSFLLFFFLAFFDRVALTSELLCMDKTIMQMRERKQKTWELFDKTLIIDPLVLPSVKKKPYSNRIPM